MIPTIVTDDFVDTLNSVIRRQPNLKKISISVVKTRLNFEFMRTVEKNVLWRFILYLSVLQWTLLR